MRAESETNHGTTYSFRQADAIGRGAEMALQFGVSALCAQVRITTGRPVAPARVALAVPAPRSYRPLGHALGTLQIDFDAPVTTITFASDDLDIAMPGADPVLASILHRYAVTLPSPPPATWQEHFRTVLNEAIQEGTPSLPPWLAA